MAELFVVAVQIGLDSRPCQKVERLSSASIASSLVKTATRSLCSLQGGLSLEVALEGSGRLCKARTHIPYTWWMVETVLALKGQS